VTKHLAILPILPVEFGERRDDVRNFGFGKPTRDALSERCVVLADASSHHDGVMRRLASILRLQSLTREADVPDVVLPTGIGTAADPDAKNTEFLHVAVLRQKVLANRRRDSHRAAHRETAVVGSGARDNVADVKGVGIGQAQFRETLVHDGNPCPRYPREVEILIVRRAEHTATVFASKIRQSVKLSRRAIT
jgi:hypothetical protein